MTNVNHLLTLLDRARNHIQDPELRAEIEAVAPCKPRWWPEGEVYPSGHWNEVHFLGDPLTRRHYVPDAALHYCPDVCATIWQESIAKKRRPVWAKICSL